MAMDYENTGRSESDAELGNLIPEAAAAFAAGIARSGAIQLVPGPGNAVVLPEGATLDDIAVRGRDLVIQLDDGRVYVITDGAVFVPEIIVDGVAIPALNFAALLTGNEPEPAVTGVRSSGGNFAEAVDPIQAAFELGNLLPYTELSFPAPQDREIIPAKPDRTPTTVIITPDQPAGAVSATSSVNEAGLPVRGSEPEGSNSAANSESTAGSIVFEATDGLASITLNGVAITAVGQTFVTPRGVLTITSIAPGNYGYSYTLTDNTLGATTTDDFAVVVTDSDGDTASATLAISIIDDAPIARNDTDEILGGSNAPATGNVITDAELDGGKDTRGADGAVVSAISGTAAGTVGGTTAGIYGVLTLNADGSYSYVRNDGTQGNVSDVFTYTLTDGDGDSSTATLTINIGDAGTSLDLPVKGEAGTLVDEAGLPAGSNAAASSETTAGTIAYTAPDGPATVTIDGVAVTAIGQVFSGSFGTLTITSIAAGSIGYSYTLTTNTAGDATFEDFAVVVTDLDGDHSDGTLVIDIVDDVPTARADADSVTEDSAVTADGNVITGAGGSDANLTDGTADTKGADGASVTAVSFGATAGTVGGTTAGAYGTLTLNANGSYSYALNNGSAAVQGLDGNDTLSEVFTYTLTDGDGDVRSTTLTVTINGSDDRITINGLNAEGPDLIVDDDDLADGSSPGAAALTQAGTFTVNGVDGIASITVAGGNVTVGQSFTTAHGTFTITSVSAPVDGTATSIVIGYSYTLSDNVAHATALGQNFLTESFAVVVTDTDGSSASDTVEVRIIDDVPTAVNDTDEILGGSNAPATGNVITDAELDGGKDTRGADGAVVSAISGTAAGTVGGTTAGIYGVLTLNADGSYSYVRNDGTQGNVSDVFTYTLTDGDGDSSTATLTINIGDAGTSLDLPVKGEAGTLVDEAGLPAGSNAAASSETTAGTIAYTAPDGPATVTIDGVAVTAIGQVFSGSFGTLTITSIAAGSIGYSYTLTTNTAGDATFEDFAVVVTDLDGDHSDGTLVIDIVDDVPTARADADSVTEDSAVTADGNVITGAGGSDANLTDGTADTKGADGASVTAVSFGATAGTVGGTTAGAYGTLTLNANGSYSYALNNGSAAVQGLDGNDTLSEVFTYTLTDGDGDVRSTTLTVTINGSDDRITINGLNAEGPDLIVDDDDLADGSSPGAAALTQAGTFTVNGVDGIASITVAGGNVTVGQSFTTAHGTFTITSVSAPVNGTATSITIGYSYVLSDNLAHANAAGQNFLTESFAVAVADTDGSVANDTIEVRIIDDVPTAANDTDTIAGGSNAPATGNVITDEEGDGGVDTRGADGAIVTAISGVSGGIVGGATTGTYGILTLNADGSYSYVRNDGSPGNVSDVFSYTITDADGDTSTATLTILIGDAAPTTRPNLTALLDDDALAGGNPLGTGDDDNAVNLSGTLSGAGGDGALTWAFQNTGAPAGFSYALNGTSLQVSQGSTLVLTVTLNSATGAYVVTQNAPIVHPAGADENNQPFTLNYSVTDADGDSAVGTLGINVDDDTPVAANDSDAVAEDVTTSAAGNVLTGVGTDGNAAGADSLGADGPAAGGAVVAVTGGALGAPIVGTYGSLTLNANGSYNFVLNNGSAAVQALDTGETVTQAYTYTIRDRDGDETTAILTITITGTNDAPVAVADTNWTVEDAAAAITGNVLNSVAHNDAPDATPRGDVADTDVDVEALSVTTTGSFNGTYGILTLNANGSYSYALYTQAQNAGAYALIQARDAGDPPLNDVFNYTASDGTATANSTLTIAVFGANDAPVVGTGAATVSEEGLANSNADTTGVSDTTNSATASGTIAISDVDVEPATVTLGDPGAVLTSNGAAVTWAGIGTGMLVGSVGANTVITITISNTGVYTVTLADNVDHAGLNVEDLKTFTVPVSVSDGTTTVPTTLTVNIEDDSPLATTNLAVQLDDDGVSGAGGNLGGTGDVNPNTANTTGTLGFSFGADGGASAGGLSFLTTGAPAGFTYEASGSNILIKQGLTTVITVTLNAATGAYTVVQNAPIAHAAGSNENDQAFTLGYSVTDRDGDSTNGSLTINVDDDTPVFTSAIQNGTANNLIGSAVSVGSLHFSDGADGTGPVGTISLTTTATSGGHALVTQQVGNVLTGYADITGNGKTGDDTAVFTLTVNPAAGASGEYVFDLIAPLDGTVVNTPIGGTTSFGSGPAPYQVVSATNVAVDPLAIITGWQTDASFNAAAWYAGSAVYPVTGVNLASVNGSTAGWGVDNNNFTTGEFIRWDFGTPLDDFDGAGGYAPPATALPAISYATFELIGYSGGDIIQFVVHYTDGTSSNATITGAALGSPVTLSAPAGKIIDWIDTYSPNAGSGKIDITSVGVQSANIDANLGFTVILTDGDGDPTAPGAFTINVKTGNSPSAAIPPIAIDLDGDGVEFLAQSAGVTFDYAGDGTRESTAWVGRDDGLLALDRNGDGIVNDGSEIVFGGNGLTDLQGLALNFDSNGDGVLSAADAEFASFGVWQDANGNGVTDTGEFSSLAEMGIASIGLTSDGAAYTAADGDVLVHGTASFTRIDGTSGSLADASFATSSTMDALLSMQTPDLSKDAAGTSYGLPAIQEAFSDSAGNHAVDRIVEHFASGSLGQTDSLDGADDFALIGLLDSPVSNGAQSGASPFEMAFMLDHQDSAAIVNG